MSLEPGQSLAHYRIDRKIGEGGMGEVWAATDTRLQRSAAIKALPAAVAADPERLARFNREAQLLASLNHPNIAAIYGLEKRGDTPYLALELVDGDDLSTRIEGRPVPVDEAIEIARQIAAALEEAHAKGIVHRDLKPANIKISADGKIKVLDFGLAKALSDDPAAGDSAPDWSRSPTMTAALGTRIGVILGTAGYMAPEQARGKAVDRRADVWAFGVILYEMLTGERLFGGETVTDVVAALVTREPDWDKLPADTPASLRRLLVRCLRKDPRKRLRDIGDAMLDLDDAPDDAHAAATATATASASAPAPSASRRAVWIVGTAGVALGLAAAFAIHAALAPAPAAPRALWSTLPALAGADYAFAKFLEISPDGRRVVYVAPAAEGGEDVLWVRDLDDERPRPLPGTEGASQPFWSPDSRSIGYFAKRKLRVIAASGGVSKTIADTGGEERGGCWSADDTILFVPGWSRPVFRIPAAGGDAEPVTTLNAERLDLSHRWPRMLPDGKHFLYFVVSTYPELNPENPTEADKSGLYLGSLDGKEVRMLTAARSRASYADGSLLYVDDAILMARPFDLDTLSFTGEPVSITEGVTQSVDSLWGGALFSVSDEGTLLFVRGASERRAMGLLRLRDRTGRELSTIGEPAAYSSVRISHDGRRAATTIGDPGDIWIHDIARGSSTRFTFDPGNDATPVWSPDDRYLLFQSNRVVPGQAMVPAHLFRKASSGLDSEEHLTSVRSGPSYLPSDWSPDGSFVLLTTLNIGTGADITRYVFADDAIEPFLAGEHDEQSPRLSPDGRWMAYESLESGRYEIYVQPYPGPGGKWQISRGGGSRPVWRGDGKELFYLGDDGLMSVAVDTQDGFRADPPVFLFDPDAVDLPDANGSYDVTPDGRRFLIVSAVVDDAHADAGTVTLLQNWRTLLP